MNDFGQNNGFDILLNSLSEYGKNKQFKGKDIIKQLARIIVLFSRVESILYRTVINLLFFLIMLYTYILYRVRFIKYLPRIMQRRY